MFNLLVGVDPHRPGGFRGDRMLSYTDAELRDVYFLAGKFDGGEGTEVLVGRTAAAGLADRRARVPLRRNVAAAGGFHDPVSIRKVLGAMGLSAAV